MVSFWSVDNSRVNELMYRYITLIFCFNFVLAFIFLLPTMASFGLNSRQTKKKAAYRSGIPER